MQSFITNAASEWRSGASAINLVRALITERLTPARMARRFARAQGLLFPTTGLHTAADFSAAIFGKEDEPPVPKNGRLGLSGHRVTTPFVRRK